VGDTLLGPITDSVNFHIDELALDCPDLNDNQIFIKLKNKLRKFFIQREEIRRYGLTRK
jgi:hypothetical protein